MVEPLNEHTHTPRGDIQPLRSVTLLNQFIIDNVTCCDYMQDSTRNRYRKERNEKNNVLSFTLTCDVCSPPSSRVRVSMGVGGDGVCRWPPQHGVAPITWTLQLFLLHPKKHTLSNAQRGTYFISWRALRVSFHALGRSHTSFSEIVDCSSLWNLQFH